MIPNRVTPDYQERTERFKVIDELRQAFKGIPPNEIEQETDRIIARIRAAEQEHGPPAASQ